MKVEIPKPEARADVIKRDADALSTELAATPLAVRSAEHALTVGDMVGQLRGQKKELQDMMGRATKPLNAALKEVRGWFQPAIKSIESAERSLAASLSRYRVEQAEAAEAARARAAEAAAEGDTDAVLEALNEAPAETKDAATATSFRWIVKHVVEADLPREYLTADMAKLKAYARATSGRDSIAPIPGVTFVRDAIIRRRS